MSKGRVLILWPLSLSLTHESLPVLWCKDAPLCPALMLPLWWSWHLLYFCCLSWSPGYLSCGSCREMGTGKWGCCAVLSGSVVSDSLQPHGLYSPWNSPGQNTGMGSLSLLWGIFPTQGSKPGFLHYRQILYPPNHKGSPRILEWVAYPFSRGSSRLRNRTGVSYTAGKFFYQLSYQTGLWLTPKEILWF